MDEKKKIPGVDVYVKKNKVNHICEREANESSICSLTPPRPNQMWHTTSIREPPYRKREEREREREKKKESIYMKHSRKRKGNYHRMDVLLPVLIIFCVSVYASWRVATISIYC